MSNTSQKVLPSCISLPLEPAVLDEIVTKAKDYALMHGICMRPKATFSPDSLSVSRWNLCYFKVATMTSLFSMINSTITIFHVYTTLSLFQFAPFVLTPSLYPRSEFEKAINLQTVLNELIHNVAHDSKFLRETLASTIKVDDFTASLFKIYETVLSEGVTQVSCFFCHSFELLADPFSWSLMLLHFLPSNKTSCS